jgi:uncharacterized membrane protein
VWWWELTYRIGPNLWVVPLLMAAASLLLFAVTRRLDAIVPAPAENARTWLPEWMVARTPADADVVLNAMLTALATALALVFSTSVLVFSLASSQLGPRLIRRFVQDPVTQVTLGAFLSGVILCTVTLGSVRNGIGSSGVPVVSYSLSVIIGLGCFVLLIFYVHRVATTIQSPAVVASVVRQLDRSLDESRAPLDGASRCTDADLVRDTAERARSEGGSIDGPASGFFQAVDELRLMDAAEEFDAVVVLVQRPGAFLVGGRPLVRVLPASRAEAVRVAVHEAVEVGEARTRRQDVEFAILQVVEIGIRALSPAVNDTITGIICVNWLGAALSRLAVLPDLTGGICGRDGTLRVVVPPLSFDEALRACFDLIRQSSARNPAVVLALLDALGAAAVDTLPEHRAALRDYADAVLESAWAAGADGPDAEDMTARHRRTIEAIAAEPELQP